MLPQRDVERLLKEYAMLIVVSKMFHNDFDIIKGQKDILPVEKLIGESYSLVGNFVFYPGSIFLIII